MRIEYNNRRLYQSQPRQTVFHNDRAPYRLYGGAAGGGKTEALIWEAFQISQSYENMHGAVIRKTYPDLLQSFIRRSLAAYPNELIKFNKQEKLMYFLETGSTIDYIYIQYEDDVFKYQGPEWDWLMIDELTQHTEFVFKYLFSRLRTTKSSWLPLFMGGTNPGGVGHTFVKRIFVDRKLRSDEGDPRNYSFTPAKVYDNKKLMDADPNYIKRLQGLPIYERKKLLEGSWDVFEGQFFDSISRDATQYQGIEMLPHWEIFLACDYGYSPHPASVGWYFVDDEGTIYRHRELAVVHHTFVELAKAIVERTPLSERDRIKELILSPDSFAKRGNKEGKSGAEEMQNAFDQLNVKWIIIPANNDRINGWNVMRQYIAPIPGVDGMTSRLKVHKACEVWWKTIPQLQHNPRNPDDLLKVGVRLGEEVWSGDDAADETRYALMTRYNIPKIKKEKPKVDRYGYPLANQKSNVRIYGRPIRQIYRPTPAENKYFVQ